MERTDTEDFLSTAGTIPISRGGVRIIDAPLSESTQGMMLPSGMVVITADDRGIAGQAVHLLDAIEQPTVLLEHVEGKAFGGVADPRRIELDLNDVAAVDATIRYLRETHGPLAGLIHLLPLSTWTDEERLVDRARRDCRTLYVLARALEDDLRAAADAGTALMFATTSIDGALGYAPDAGGPIARAAHGGILGMTKCIGLEWPTVVVRALDFSPSMPAESVCEALAAELSQVNSPLEIGISESGRVTWEPQSAPLEDHDSDDLILQPGETVVVTGGGRGITAEIAVGLAKAFQPHLVLLGRSPLPNEDEHPSIRAAETEVDVKTALIAAARRRGEKPKPAEIGKHARRIMASREIRHTLSRIQSAGSAVEYRSVDVADPAALTAAIREIQSAGPIAGVIHGAGIIDDKLLRDKTPESFDRVFDTKVVSTATLIDSLDPRGLKFLALFASVASRFGNRGQSDYAAANEVLGKAACILNELWPQTHSFAIAWGPWSSIGMVADLERHLTARGLTLISPETGVEMFLKEIRSSNGQTPEVIIAGGAEQLASPT